MRPQGSSETRASDLRHWYKVRDTLLGWNFAPQDVARALALVRDCKHEDGRWLARLFRGVASVTKDEAKEVFLAQGDDARALCFAARVSTFDDALMRRSAELGYAAAQVWLSLWSDDPCEKWALAQQAFSQHERTAVALMAEYLWHGQVCLKDEKRSLQLFREAAKMDHVLSQHYLAVRGYEARHPKRYKWFGLAAANGNGDSRDLLVAAAAEQVAQWEEGVDCATLVTAIGAACKGHVDVEMRCVFVAAMSAEEAAAVANAVELSAGAAALARDAVLLWLCFAERMGGFKDPAQMIAKLLWAERSAWCQQWR